MELTELLARFKGFQKAVIILLVALMVCNVVTLAWILSRLSHLDRRLPISVRCSGASVTVPAADRVSSVSVEADMDLVAQGRVGAEVTFRLTEKVPGSQVVLAYRVRGTSEWLETPMTPGKEALTFTASVPLGAKDEVEYRLEQRVYGEAVHVSSVHLASMPYLMGGNGDLHVDYFVTGDSSKEGRLIIYSFHGRPKMEALQVAEVRLKIKKTRSEQTAVLKDTGSGDFLHVFDPDGLKEVEITVLYKDGEARTSTFDPSLPKTEGPLIIR